MDMGIIIGLTLLLLGAANPSNILEVVLAGGAAFVTTGEVKVGTGVVTGAAEDIGSFRKSNAEEVTFLLLSVVVVMGDIADTTGWL